MAIDMSVDLIQATVQLEQPLGNGMRTVGTGFLISDPTPDGTPRVVLVTANHVFEKMPGDKATIGYRIENADGSWRYAPETITIRKSGKALWTHHANRDVAAISITASRSASAWANWRRSAIWPKRHRPSIRASSRLAPTAGSHTAGSRPVAAIAAARIRTSARPASRSDAAQVSQRLDVLGRRLCRDGGVDVELLDLADEVFQRGRRQGPGGWNAGKRRSDEPVSAQHFAMLTARQKPMRKALAHPSLGPHEAAAA